MSTHVKVLLETSNECRISGILLKIGVERGLTPQELAQFYIRKEKPSLLEKIVQECIEQVKVYQFAHQVIGNDGAMCMSGI